MPCDRRVPGAAAPTAAGGRRRKVMQARNREFRGQNAERESGRPDFEVGKAGSNPVSAIEKRDTRKNLVSFFYALRPTGSRGCSTDRCRWQKKEGDAGEKSGVPRTERREGERTTRFRGGQGRFKSCLRNRKERYKKKSCIFFLCPATEKAVFHTDWAQVRQNKAR